MRSRLSLWRRLLTGLKGRKRTPEHNFFNFFYKNLRHNIDYTRKMRYNIIAGRDTLYTYETELTFKRSVSSPDIGSRLWAAFFYIILR